MGHKNYLVSITSQKEKGCKQLVLIPNGRFHKIRNISLVSSFFFCPLIRICDKLWSIWKCPLTSAHGSKKTNQSPDHLSEVRSWCWFLGTCIWMWHTGPLGLPPQPQHSLEGEHLLFYLVGDECMLMFIFPLTCALGIPWIELFQAPSTSGLYFPCPE